MQRGEIWFAATPGGDRPVLVLTRVVNFDNVHTLGRETFRRRVVGLSPARMAQACRTLRNATGC